MAKSMVEKLEEEVRSRELAKGDKKEAWGRNALSRV